MGRVKLSPPWDIYYREVTAMFEKDPEVRVVYDEDNLDLKLFVSSLQKAEALANILPTQKEYGNVTLNISVVPPNVTSNLKYGKINDFEAAFKDNPVVDEIVHITEFFGTDFHFVMFKKEVVQYYTDMMFDLNGLTSTLYENIARDIFEPDDNTYFCTSTDIKITSWTVSL